MNTRMLKHACVAAVLGIGGISIDMMAGREAAQAQAVPDLLQAAANQAGAMEDLRSAVQQTAAVVEGLVSDIAYEYSEQDGPWTRVMLSNVRAIPPMRRRRSRSGISEDRFRMDACWSPPNCRFSSRQRVPRVPEEHRLERVTCRRRPSSRVAKMDAGEVLVNSGRPAVTEWVPAASTSGRRSSRRPQERVRRRRPSRTICARSTQAARPRTFHRSPCGRPWTRSRCASGVRPP